ncbi:MAG: N-acetylneuraminate synthase [Sphingosinicella sp.]|nr:N-acetylneuraminate synthase [Sphingosinicella sp.]
MTAVIIAEAGVNHNGDLEQAKALVHAAARAGADFVKFQTFRTELSVTRYAPKAQYQLNSTASDESQFEMIRKLELSEADHYELLEECLRAGIRFFSTGFDTESIDFLVGMGIDRLKVPSGEITNLPLLRHISSKGLPIILSTGMADLREIEDAVAVFLSSGIPKERITVLHCNTEYPTPMEDVNLHAMLNIAQALQVEIGYSDHTLGIEIPVAAVALGATVIEKHFTLDRNLSGPDHQASLDPDELAAMVRAIRNVEAALSGDGIKRPSASELRNREIARKSLVAVRPIHAGEPYEPHHLAAKRPGTGISPMRWDEIIGTRAIRDFDIDELIEI